MRDDGGLGPGDGSGQREMAEIGDRFQRLPDGLWVWAEGEVENDPGFLAMRTQKDGEAFYLKRKLWRNQGSSRELPRPLAGVMPILE